MNLFHQLVLYLRSLSKLYTLHPTLTSASTTSAHWTWTSSLHCWTTPTNPHCKSGHRTSDETRKTRKADSWPSAPGKIPVPNLLHDPRGTLLPLLLCRPGRDKESEGLSRDSAGQQADQEVCTPLKLLGSTSENSPSQEITLESASFPSFCQKPKQEHRCETGSRSCKRNGEKREVSGSNRQHNHLHCPPGIAFP